MICLSVFADDFDTCEALLSHFPFIEFRLDKTKMNTNEIKNLFRAANRTIATCRSIKFEDSKRIEILKTAIQSGARYVDFDYKQDIEIFKFLKKECQTNNCKIILSYHNPESTPTLDELNNIKNQIKTSQPDIYKIACKVNDKKDIINLLSLYQDSQNDLIAIGLGEKGKITRIAAINLGAPFTYASIDDNQETAPGQINYQTLKKIFELMK